MVKMYLQSTFCKLVRPAWWKLLLLSALLAIGIALWPTVKCAIADCGPRDQWCDGDCGKTCGDTTGVNKVVACTPNGSYCAETVKIDYETCVCTNPGDCECTGEGFPYWNVGRCGTVAQGCPILPRTAYITCCEGSGHPAPTPCPVTPPAISTPALQPTPAYPLVIGQDPNRQGVTISALTATAGAHHCAPATITKISVEIRLAEASIAWINGELARRYPGAHVKGVYPLTPTVTATGLGTPTVTAGFHFEPLDPGDYQITVTATQDDGQTAVKTFTVHVALYEATITR